MTTEQHAYYLQFPDMTDSLFVGHFNIFVNDVVFQHNSTFSLLFSHGHFSSLWQQQSFIILDITELMFPLSFHRWGFHC
jgi:hypothetical protein